MNREKTRWSVFVFVISVSVLTACGPGQIFGPTITPTSTTTPTPTATPPPSPTPTLLERIKSIEDFPRYPGASGYEYNGSMLLNTNTVILSVNIIRKDPGNWDEFGLVTLPVNTRFAEVVSFYKSIGFEFEEFSDSGRYYWERRDGNGDIVIQIAMDYFEQEENENGPTLLILLSDRTN